MPDLIKALGDAVERAWRAPQTTTVTDWTTTPATDRVAELPPRVTRRGKHLQHLSECLLFIDPTAHCTCDDDSPEWTL